MQILDFLRQPYPFDDYKERSHFRKFVVSVAQGVFITLFLMTFEPFGISNWKAPDKINHLIGFGAVTTIVGLIHCFVIIPLNPSVFTDEKWTVGKEILTTCFLILLIAIGNSIYLNIALGQRTTFSIFLFNVSSVVLVGAFLVTFGVLANYIIQLKKYQQPIKIAVHENELQEINLVAENEKDFVKASIESLLFIESADNYSVVNLVGEKSTMLRSSLTRLVDQISHSEVVRCHRSFIVNLSQVEKVSGNAQGYKLHLKDCDTLVPVARKYSKIVDKLK